MSNKIYGIYIPGLGDHESHGQDRAIKDWAKYGYQLNYHPVGWAESKPFVDKLKHLANKIDQLYDHGGKVVLIGASAGAGGAINAAASRPHKVKAVVSICGKILYPDFSHPAFKNNPAFIESMKMLPKSLAIINKTNIALLSVNSVFDGRVPTKDTYIEGAKKITLPMIGHVPTIAYSLSFGKKKIISSLKN